MHLRLQQLKHTLDTGAFEPTSDEFITEIDALMYASCIEFEWALDEAELLLSILGCILKSLDSSTITRFHRDYLKICSRYSFYEKSDEVLDSVWTCIDPTTPQSVVSELYSYSASIHIAKGDFYEAQWALLSILVVPYKEAHISAIRKLFLVQLILNGSVSALPTYITCSTILEIWKSLTQPVENANDMSPEKKVRKGSSIVHPEEYRPLLFSLSALNDLKYRLVEGGDWELAQSLDRFHHARRLTDLSNLCCTASRNFSMQFLNASQDQLQLAIETFNQMGGLHNIESDEDWVRFVLVQQKPPLDGKQKIILLVESLGNLKT